MRKPSGLLIGLVCLGLSASANAWSFFSATKSESLPFAEDFVIDGAQAQAEQKPIVLFVSADHCTYCHTLKAEILHPMLIAGDYKDAILLRNVDLDRGGMIVGFAGERLKPSQFLARHFPRAQFTPSLLFVDGQGREIAPRLVGYNNFEFYSYELEERINQALSALGSPRRFDTFRAPIAP